jgi:hypothetical protein
VLVKLAQLAAYVPEIRELDINPLLSDQDKLIAIDARVAIAPLAGGHQRPVRPYPKKWEPRSVCWIGRCSCVRWTRTCIAPSLSGRRRRIYSSAPLRAGARFEPPVHRPADADRLRACECACRYRPVQRGNALCRVAACGRRLRPGRIHRLVCSDLKGLGLGWRLMQTIIEYGRWLGLRAQEKSDSAIVDAKPPNKTGKPAAECGGAKGGDQGERGAAKHTPDPDEPRTASCKSRARYCARTAPCSPCVANSASPLHASPMTRTSVLSRCCSRREAMRQNTIESLRSPSGTRRAD